MPLYEKRTGSFALPPKAPRIYPPLPLKCVWQEFPYKTGIVYTDSSFLAAPKTYHPLSRLLRLAQQRARPLDARAPAEDVPAASPMPLIRQKLAENLSQENIRKEIHLFRNKENKGFERIYGWSWLLQLQQEAW